MASENAPVTRILNVFSDALGVSIGQEIYVAYRASSRNRPHVKRAKVVQCQATIAGEGGDITLLCEDYSGARYVYRYDQVIIDINDALRFVTMQGMREDMGLDEFCQVVDPNFRYKRKHDENEAMNSPMYDPSRTVDEEERERLLRRINERLTNPNYWKDGFRK